MKYTIRDYIENGYYLPCFSSKNFSNYTDIHHTALCVNGHTNIEALLENKEKEEYKKAKNRLLPDESFSPKEKFEAKEYYCETNIYDSIKKYGFYPLFEEKFDVTFFTGAKSIGDRAFYQCSLTSVSFPLAESIGNGAFWGCTSLGSVDLPKATSIGDEAFAFTEGFALMTITLGNITPTVGINMFNGVSTAKTVIVRYPARVDYGEVPSNIWAYNWGNAFRGAGSFFYNSSFVNSNITLVYDVY